MPTSFKVGDSATWTSQAGGYTVEKIGVVEEVVPAGHLPNRDRFLPLYKSSGISMPRDHESYVVRVKGRGLYGPRVSALVAPKLSDSIK